MNQLQENQLAKKLLFYALIDRIVNKLFVTIKSLYAHQRGLRIYVFDKGDIPQE